MGVCLGRRGGSEKEGRGEFLKQHSQQLNVLKHSCSTSKQRDSINLTQSPEFHTPLRVSSKMIMKKLPSWSEALSAYAPLFLPTAYPSRQRLDLCRTYCHFTSICSAKRTFMSARTWSTSPRSANASMVATNARSPGGIPALSMPRRISSAPEASPARLRVAPGTTNPRRLLELCCRVRDDNFGIGGICRNKKYYLLCSSSMYWFFSVKTFYREQNTFLKSKSDN